MQVDRRGCGPTDNDINVQPLHSGRRAGRMHEDCEPQPLSIALTTAGSLLGWPGIIQWSRAQARPLRRVLPLPPPLSNSLLHLHDGRGLKIVNVECGFISGIGVSMSACAASSCSAALVWVVRESQSGLEGYIGEGRASRRW